MIKVLIVLLIGLVFEAVGVVLLSRGLKQIQAIDQINLVGIVDLIRRGAANPSILTGIAFEAVFFIILLYLLSQRDVSLIWPLTSLGFVITAIAARWILDEYVSWIRWGGVILIVFGASLVSYSEVLTPKSITDRPLSPPPIEGQSE